MCDYLDDLTRISLSNYGENGPGVRKDATIEGIDPAKKCPKTNIMALWGGKAAILGVNFAPAMLIETHAHLYDKSFKVDMSELMARGHEAGLSEIMMPNIDHTSIDAMLELELAWANPANGPVAKAMMGLHPCYVKKGFEQELYLIESWVQKRKWLAIGEIGTDLYWDKTTWDIQAEAFNIQCQWALNLGRPVVIHCRESVGQTIELVRPWADKGLNGVFHCWSGTGEQAQSVTQMGFYLGIGGTATYKNSSIADILKGLDTSFLVLETDSPYLTPVPHRGKRNEPAYIAIVAQKLADLLHMPLEDLESLTTTNARRLFAW